MKPGNLLFYFCVDFRTLPKVTGPRVSIHPADGRLTARSWSRQAARFGFTLFQIGQAAALPRCLQISERHGQYNTLSPGFNSPRHLAVRRLTAS